MIIAMLHSDKAAMIIDQSKDKLRWQGTPSRIADILSDVVPLREVGPARPVKAILEDAATFLRKAGHKLVLFVDLLPDRQGVIY